MSRTRIICPEHNVVLTQCGCNHPSVTYNEPEDSPWLQKLKADFNEKLAAMSDQDIIDEFKALGCDVKVCDTCQGDECTCDSIDNWNYANTNESLYFTDATLNTLSTNCTTVADTGNQAWLQSNEELEKDEYVTIESSVGTLYLCRIMHEYGNFFGPTIKYEPIKKDQMTKL